MYFTHFVNTIDFTHFAKQVSVFWEEALPEVDPIFSQYCSWSKEVTPPAMHFRIWLYALWYLWLRLQVIVLVQLTHFHVLYPFPFAFFPESIFSHRAVTISLLVGVELVVLIFEVVNIITDRECVRCAVCGVRFAACCALLCTMVPLVRSVCDPAAARMRTATDAFSVKIRTKK